MFMRRIVVLWLAGSLVGCSGFSQLQGSIEKFNQGAHSVATNEINFLKAVQTADCNDQFYSNAHDWAMGQGKAFNISGDCKPRNLTDKQFQIRQGLMDALTLYADKMQALSSSDDSKTLDSNSQKLAINLNSLAKQEGVSSPTITADVEAAVIAIAEMALDQKRFTDIKTAAAAMSPSLQKIVEALKTENTSFSQGIAGNLGDIQMKMEDILVSTHEKRGAMSFFDVVEMRRTMQSINPLGLVPLAASTVQPSSDPQHVTDQLNAALDAIVKANQAIATADTGGIKIAVNDLVTRAKAAQTDQNSLAK